MKKGSAIIIDSYDTKKVVKENEEMAVQLQIYQSEVEQYQKELLRAQNAYTDAVNETIRLHNLLDAGGIQCDPNTTPESVCGAFSKKSEENLKLKEILHSEGIEYDNNTMIYKGNKVKYALQIALKEANRLKKLAKLPVIDLWDAVERGSISYATYFLETDPNSLFEVKNGSTVLHRAFELGDMEMIKFLVDHGSNKDQKTSNGTSTVMLAARSGSIDAFNFAHEDIDEEELLKPRPDGLTTLHCAVAGGNVYIVKYLVAKGAEINAKTDAGVTPLMCIEEYNSTIFDFLVESGAKVNVATVTNRTMIHVACRSGSYEFIQKIVSFGVSLKSVTTDGCNALHMAVVGGNQLVIQTLLNDFSINSKTNLGYTPLLIAIQAEDLELCKFLLSFGADISMTLNDGKTALHIAALTGSISICKFLIDKGVPIDSEDNEHRTPVMLALAQRYVQLVDYLCSRGAKLEEKFDEQTRKFTPPSKPKVIIDPMVELPTLRKENEELKKSHAEMKAIIDDYEADHPVILLAEEMTQTDVSGATYKRLVNQIGIVTIAPDKDIAAKIKIYQAENRKLLSEISELSNFCSSFNAVKHQLTETSNEIEKLSEENVELEKLFTSKKKRQENEHKKLQNTIYLTVGMCILILASLIYLITKK